MGTALPRALLLIGPTAAGKTPLGERLESAGLRGAACHHFDFGARLRAAADGEVLSPADREAVRAALRAGVLLTDAQFPIAAALLEAFIAERRPGAGDLVVLNGLPRHAGQAADIAALVEVVALVELTCPPEVVVERIRTDAGGDRSDRVDDSLAAVRERLLTYGERTAPLAAWYRERGVEVVGLEVGARTTAGDLLRRLEEVGAGLPV